MVRGDIILKVMVNAYMQIRIIIHFDRNWFLRNMDSEVNMFG